MSTPVLLALTIAAVILAAYGIRRAWRDYRDTFPPDRYTAEDFKRDRDNDKPEGNDVSDGGAPNELVEAAAKAAGPLVWREELERALAAVLPIIEQREEVCSRCGDHFSEHPDLPHVCGGCMIGTSEDDRVADAEQRVIDRLAREAGENPYTLEALRARDPHAPWVRLPQDAWDRGAACGVAAERARTTEVLSLIYVMLTGAEPMWAEMPIDERCARAANEAQQAVLAALAPERTGEGNDA